MIALGSNVGNRPQNIQSALKLLETNKCQVLATSFLYESPASYVTNQPSFVNAACKIATSHGPDELLKVLKVIEKEVGRQERFRWGPREVDLDILFYNHSVCRQVYENADRTLTIPHPRLCERDFVLGPMCDIEPGWIHPVQRKPVVSILKELLQSQKADRCTLSRIFPVKQSGSSRGSYTSIMGILNVTPDSFSDGNKFFDLQSALRQFKNMVAAGADVIDIGGQSTRPNAKYLEAEEELERVLPLIEAVRREGIDTLISIDTFHSAVAKKAIEAGADMINDVSGGLLDPKMLEVAAALHAPICLMHYRGNAASMQDLCNYPEDLVAAVASELRSQCNAALKAGVPKWNIIVDPGIGFAKTSEQSVAVLRDARRFQDLTSPFGDVVPRVPRVEELSLDRSFPLLIGPSRKSFIGSILEEKDAASERRLWGTAASCTAAVQQGANFLRVHDVKQMKDVAAIADAIYRRG
ncbi:hypothetical protein GUITHDRAFT_157785 [Guillardia theta CCMP2712]|uniref:Pterin-binding domain-containing protein n=1 Tax=Guillardia theta (strain CCMP2712) TaxID=905079 RepID=L1JCF3_GUITC|nr:hypothetical protein GUITHDRAFT_157785 [Guillardia theta CCMP2712]EKX45997.1 hypothetical protein GUITHDRAFT_157785 [Guillardia theta CCMP2712]|eukprot:XP_005832977.1 hypothetical protein GUITHDRAFT_157785 [Guillardia theta CCMP2712]